MSSYLFDLTQEKQKAILDILKFKGIGKEMPMLSIPFLDWFNSYSFKHYLFIEIGSGYSTEYFYKKVGKFVSYETDIIFYNDLKNKINPNIDYRFINMKDLMHGNFDLPNSDKTIVFIDNDCNRYRSSFHSINKVNPDIIIVDNSEYIKDTCSMISSMGYNEIPFWGVRPEISIDGCTSVFIKHGAIMPEKRYEFVSDGRPPRLDPFETISDNAINSIIDGHEESERLNLPCSCNKIYQKIKSGEIK
jgi:hypothetical protein